MKLSAHFSRKLLLPIPLLAVGVLLFSTGFTLSRVPDQDDHQVYLPLVSLAPPDVYGQFLNSIGGKDNLFYVAGPLAFSGHGHQLVVLDISEPANPVYLTEVQLPSAPTFMVVQDGYGYITLGEAGIAVLDLRQPAQATILSRLPLAGTSRHLLLSAGLVFVSSSQALYVVDISQPEFPRVLGSTTLDANYSQFHESLLLVKTMAGFDLIDISNTVAPVIIGIYENYWTLNIVAVEGDYVYMNGYGCGMLGCDYYLDIIDISDPSDPLWTNMLDLMNPASSMFFNGDIAYIADNNIIIARVKPGGVLEQVSIYQPAAGSGMFLLENDLLYLGSSGSLEILDVSNPINPEQISLYTNPSFAIDLIQHDLPYIYYRANPTVEGKGKSLLVLDVSDPAEPALISEAPLSSFNIQTGFWVEQVYLDGDNLYLTVPTGKYAGFFPIVSLRIFDLQQPAVPVEVAEYLPGSSGQGAGVWFEGLHDSVQIKDSLGYIMTNAGDLEIVDLNSPATPVVLSTVPANARMVNIDHSYAYLVSEEYSEPYYSLHLLTLDVSNPRYPNLLANVVITSSLNTVFYSFEVSNGIAYIGLPGFLHLIDVSTPLSPTELSALPINSQFNPTSIEVEGDLALIGVENRLEVIDVSDPISPTHLATFDAGEPFIINQILDSNVYLAGLSDALVVDIKVPDLPRLLLRYPGYAPSIQTKRGYPVYISRWQEGLEIYRPYPPAIPR